MSSEPETLPPCANCRSTATPLVRDEGGAAFVCAPGHGCGRGRPFAQALGQVQQGACARPLCPRPAARRGRGALCDTCARVDHVSRLEGLRGVE